MKGVTRTLLVALAVSTGALAPSARSAGAGVTPAEAPSGAERERSSAQEPAERSGGSFPAAIGWVALGLGIAFVIVLVGLSNAETVSE